MGSRRPLPVPPYPGIIPYTVDNPREDDDHKEENSPTLLVMEQRPISSFGFPPQSSITELRGQNWQKQQVCVYWHERAVFQSVSVRAVNWQ